MDARALLQSKSHDIAALCRRDGVVRLRVFGSALRSDWDPVTSDFDFLAEFGPPPHGVNRFDQQFGLIVDLESLLGHPVEVVDWNAAKKPLFREMADSQSEEVYAAC